MRIDRDHVVRRLCDAREWALYVQAGLTQDERYEPGKQELLEGLADPAELRALQDASRELADRLGALVEQLTIPDAQYRAMRGSTSSAHASMPPASESASRP